MEKYEVEITEYLQRTIEVEAESPSDAVDIVEEDYDNCNIVLDYSDFTDKDIEIYNPNKFIPKLDLLMDRIDKYNKDSGLNKARTQEELAKDISTYANKLFECYKMNDNADLNDVEEKLAEVMKYCLQMSMFLKLNPIEIINNKMDKKEEKFN